MMLHMIQIGANSHMAYVTPAVAFRYPTDMIQQSIFHPLAEGM